MIRAWFAARRQRELARHVADLERLHLAEMEALNAKAAQTIGDLYVHFALRLAAAETRFLDLRRVDIVEHSDRCLHVLPDETVVPFDAEIGRC